MNKDIKPYFHTPDPEMEEDGSLGIPFDLHLSTKASIEQYIEDSKRVVTSFGMSSGIDGEPVPPMKFVRIAEHHWLEKKDSDGHSAGLIVLQWNPGAKRWSHSGYVGSGIYVNTEHWVYHSHCPMPE